MKYYFSQFSSVAQSCPTLCDPMDCSTPGLPVHQQLPEFTRTHVHRVGDAIQPSHILCFPLLLPPSICPSIRVFSSESVFRIWWPKYWTCIGQILDKQVLDKVLRGTLLKRQDSQQPKGGNHPDVHRSPVVHGEWWGSSDLLRVASPS